MGGGGKGGNRFLILRIGQDNMEWVGRPEGLNGLLLLLVSMYKHSGEWDQWGASLTGSGLSPWQRAVNG